LAAQYEAIFACGEEVSPFSEGWGILPLRGG
jgi:hypothetical protein